MTNLIYLYGRNGSTRTYSDSELEEIARRITPDNAPFDPIIKREDDTVICLTDRSQKVPLKNKSVCIGVIIPKTQNWYKPGSRIPGGTYTMVRADENLVELISDMSASRTLYYRIFDDILVASTSQRAVMHFSDSFQPDKDALLWMLSSGTLGPKQSWDERIKVLPPSGELVLKRSNWKTDLNTNKVPYKPVQRSKSELLSELDENLHQTISDMNLDYSNWVLPLSGGVDSRALLHLLQDKKEMITITWGTPDSIKEKENDAYIARELAKEYGFDHEFHSKPEVPNNIDRFFDRYLTAGEGRTDSIAGYTDGFKVFEDLVSKDIKGMIRGDHVFGYDGLTPFTNVRRVMGSGTLEDVMLIDDSLSDLDMIPWAEEQYFPKDLQKRPDESREDWRDRLRLYLQIPSNLASLSALKTPYLEIVNPFLSKNILNIARSLPAGLRDNKKLWKDYVLSKTPDIPLATEDGNPGYGTILKDPDMISYIKNNIDSTESRELLGNDLLDYTLKRLDPEKSGDPIEKLSKDLLGIDVKKEALERLPAYFTKPIADKTRIKIPRFKVKANRLALRIYIITEMVKKLKDDAKRSD